VTPRGVACPHHAPILPTLPAGYLTFFTPYWVHTVRYLMFIVQSTAHSAAYLESRVEAFLPMVGVMVPSLRS
jgi:hypothetical protein